MQEPGDFVRDTSHFAIPDGSGDRFSGYAVIGQPFSSGHVLALRCFEASSLGTAYTSVWHRDPNGRWTFHQNVPPEQSCPRYFGAAITENTTQAIRIEWTDRRRFRVTVDAPGEIVWEIAACADAGNQDDEHGREHNAFLVVGESEGALRNGDRGTMDTGNRRDETDRLHAERSGVHGGAAIDLVDCGEPGDDTRGRCGHTRFASEAGQAGRFLYTAARNFRYRHLSHGRIAEPSCQYMP